MISWRNSLRLLIGSLLFIAATAAFAQPYGAWFVVSPGYPTNHGYVQLPSSLSFAGQSFTFEAWVFNSQAPTTAEDCRSLAGNGFTQSTWIGLCFGTKLRSYIGGSGTLFNSGDIRLNDWTHIAVTFDNATKVRRHYIDGELVGERTETGPIPASTSAWRIFSDASWERTLTGSIDDVRFWNVARTIDQIRSTINVRLLETVPTLVADYPLDGNANDAFTFALNGTRVGAGNFVTGAVGTGCTTTANELCVGPSGRFSIRATWQTASASGNGSVAALTTSESGIFWFFSATNWEVIVKVLNGCGLNNRWWVFTSGLTNQHYELEVTDIRSGTTKRYFNFQGVIAPQVQDLDAFPTCF